jgi:hypothetical protein
VTRWWNELVSAVTDVVPVPLTVLGLVLFALIAGMLLYFWPAWLPRRWPRLPRRSRQRRSAARTSLEEPMESVEPEDLPNLPVAAFVSLADRFAAEGRFPEAIRERLRAMVRDLVDHGVVDPRPGSTVSELATAAGRARPELAAPASEATGIFSDIWYGMVPATASQDQRMRALVTAAHDLLSPPAGPVTTGGRR